MAKQRVVNTRFWDDDYIMALGPTEKLVFLYVLTNPLTDLCGAYQITLKRICFDTGLKPAKLLEILSRFEEAGKIIYRDGWIVIKNFAKHQVSNPKVAKGIERSLNDCPDWIKHTLSIGYHSPPHLNPNLNLNLNLKGQPKPEREPTHATRDAAIHSGECSAAISKSLGVKKLPNEKKWHEVFEWSFLNGFTTQAVIECFTLMRRQKWRTGAIRPETLMDNLPELDKLRQDIANQENGTRSTNNGKGGKRSDADILAASREQLDREYGEDTA